MDAEGFGNCSNHGECEAVCPKGISILNITRMRRDYMGATRRAKPPRQDEGG
jgi:succinate dehydrogenase / fumarate reductase, iron-sulfur subunit